MVQHIENIDLEEEINRKLALIAIFISIIFFASVYLSIYEPYFEFRQILPLEVLIQCGKVRFTNVTQLIFLLFCIIYKHERMNRENNH